MRFLFVSKDLIAGNIAYLLTQEGHDVRLFIEEEDRRNNFHLLVPKTNDWKAELPWVGKDGVIVFDDVGYGLMQDALRKDGYNVFGGSLGGDSLEENRVTCRDVLARYGIPGLAVHNFDDIDDAITFVEDNPKSWVVKQNGSSGKHLNYVGFFDDGRDVLDVLEAYKARNIHQGQVITLQEKVNGVEIAITRYFNGKDWVGPMLLNVEHKKFFPGDIGPTTSEMGTLGWYDENENNVLFQKTLAPLKSYLAESGYRGIFDLNCIVNEKGVFPLEATSRFGSPIAHLQSELNDSPWGELIAAIARGESYDLKCKKGFGIVVVIAIPPFPYAKKIEGHSQFGTHIYFLDSMTDTERKHVHLEEVSLNAEDKRHYISDTRGYVLYVTGHGKTVPDAQKMAYDIVKKTYIPKMMYRYDIGDSFIEKNQKKLQEWGFLS